MHTFEVQVTPAMARRAWNAWALPRPRQLWLPLLAVGLMIPGIMFDVQKGRWGTSSIVGVSVLGFLLCVYVLVYFIGLRRALAKLATFAEGRCAYTLTEDTIEARSSIGSMALAWRALSEVRRQSDLVFVGFHGTGYSTIPATQIPPEALAYLVSQAKQHGAKISGF